MRLFLSKKLVGINLNFQNPKIYVVNHHRNNLKPIPVKNEVCDHDRK